MINFEKTEKNMSTLKPKNWKLKKNTKFYSIRAGDINSEKVKNIITSNNADIIAVYGTSLLNNTILNNNKKFVNIHLGLSPYYKGMACTLWPFYNKEPQYVGVTVHLLDNKIDNGPILHQDLVNFEIKDTIHDGSMKVIKSGVRLLAKSISEYFNKKLISYKQDSSMGKTFYLHNMNDQIIKNIENYWTEKKFNEYIKNQDNLKKN